ncbi:hypothetical protein ABPG74_017714 [Tetrahymena malaccensis]
MEVEQHANITLDLDVQILEQLQNKKALIDKQLQILCDLENQTKEELTIWEEKCKNLRQIYNYYNYSQAQYPRNLIQKEPIQNAKFIQTEMQIQSQQAQEMPQVQQKLQQSQVLERFQKQQNQEIKNESIEKKQNSDELMQKKLINLSPIQQDEVQNKNVAMKNVQHEDGEFEDDFEEQKDNSNKNEFKLQKTSQNNQLKKMKPAAQNLIQEINSIKVEKKIRNYTKKFTFPKDQIIAPSDENLKIDRKDELQQHQKLDNFKTFEQYMEKYINKFQDENPQNIQKQLQKAKKIKTILGVPDEKLIISHKWLKQFKSQISRNPQ